MTQREQALLAEHHELFGARECVRLFRAPGRVNLIGEHTDYNDGFVFPMAIDRDILIAVSPREDELVTIHAVDFEDTATFSVSDLQHASGTAWSVYPKGVVAVLKSRGDRLRGFDAVFNGTVPIGAGLSSSAALEVATGVMLCAISGLDIGRPELARLCQKAENEYAGVQCGIMDQFISCVAEPHSALFLDCRSLSYEHVPIAAEGHCVVIANTNKPRGLVDSEYNNRRKECEEAVRVISRSLPDVSALRDVSEKDLERYSKELSPVVARRAEHVVSENARVLKSIEALKNHKLGEFGELMNLSHESLRDQYEVSCRELDLLVEIALSCSGVLGARMTGGGFGGCTVTLVERDAVEALESEIRERYPGETGYEPEVYVCQPSSGAGEVNVELA